MSFWHLLHYTPFLRRTGEDEDASAAIHASALHATACRTERRRARKLGSFFSPRRAIKQNEVSFKRCLDGLHRPVFYGFSNVPVLHMGWSSLCRFPSCEPPGYHGSASRTARTRAPRRMDEQRELHGGWRHLELVVASSSGLLAEVADRR